MLLEEFFCYMCSVFFFKSTNLVTQKNISSIYYLFLFFLYFFCSFTKSHEMPVNISEAYQNFWKIDWNNSFLKWLLIDVVFCYLWSWINNCYRYPIHFTSLLVLWMISYQSFQSYMEDSILSKFMMLKNYK